ncbi:Alpha/Beta hydrolase protein [Microdochium trichocladiopsis]|uniref:Carboxylic ester hydrolase n=1 Tax=Microdochium trichocladiopsis TaxID=1682393 RepID=A0A9P8XS30_9PEZI|nr:Alpha/Beta hydrolase protein [Microdochium trichocladiopsis]KAH7014480.1 Alpha/Beta hydrolase protein [Microdochium trichocladiopsis]
MAPLQTLLASALAGLATFGSSTAILSTRRHDADPTVQIKNGTYRGVHSAQYNQDFFLGIPYAQPPVGNLRFRQAHSLNETWDGVRDAVEYSKECVGYGSDQWPYEVSEDCLTLNVIRPAGCSEDEKLPVALWIHGGGFYMGGNPDQRYNTSFIIQQSVELGKPIMTVAINYRLSAWGFLAGDDLLGQGLLNMGLRDQRLALHWVQENIAAFGGDPERVTIWGESAGAASVGFQIQAYGGRDDKLFSAAIAQSGGPIHYGALRGTQAFQQSYNAVVNATNCTDSFDKVQCLREVPFETLNTIFNGTLGNSFGPSLDGDFVQNYGSIQLERGDFVKVPLLIGANTNEGRGFLGPIKVNTTQDFRNVIGSGTGAASGADVPSGFKDLLVEAYPNNWTELAIVDPAETWIGDSRGANFVRAAAYQGDYSFTGPRRGANEMWAKWGIKSYAYRFNAIATLLNNGIGHFTEVIYVFNNLDAVGYQSVAGTFKGLPESHKELSTFMARSWIGFFTERDPNAWAGRDAGVDAWPVYSLETPEDFVFDANVTSHVEPDTFRKEGIKLINDNAAGIYHR